MKPLTIWTYVFSLALWLALCCGVAVIVVELNVHEVEIDLTRYGDAYSDHLDKELVSNETVLKGFSALFNAIGISNPRETARYVRQVIKTNPQIFALEVVQAVKKENLAEFAARKRREGIANFAVKSFSYDSDRKWQAPDDQPLYYPIVFMEPMLPSSEDVLGLDVSSVPLLRHAMSEALRRGTPVASHPFKLVQGNLAYVVFCPIPRAVIHNGAAPAHALQGEMMVDMVIDVAKLAEPDKFPVMSGGTVLVYHKDFSPDDAKGQLLKLSGKARSPLETALFPAFVYKKALATMGEPFYLMVTRQVGWSDLSLGLLALTSVLSIVSSLILLAYLRAHQQGRILAIENQNRLWQLANHDALTGLPNRMLLMDRLGQLLPRMARQGKRLALMFLDLDDFKLINDTYGHDVGDRLLKFVAERLRASVRAEDTVARMGGDEFIILVENAESRAALDAVSDKIRHMLADGLTVAEAPIRTRISIGIAIFPDDGNTPDALIKAADMRMYEGKHARKGGR